MKKAFPILALLVAAFVSGRAAIAQSQRKPCDELKAEIAAKLDAKGVKNYTLSIVNANEVKETDKVVGSCDGGTKRIVYTRG